MAALVAYLGPSYQAQVQLDALRALHNLCKLSSSRQEAAALGGIVPALCAFAQQPSPRSASGEALWPMWFSCVLHISVSLAAAARRPLLLAASCLRCVPLRSSPRHAVLQVRQQQCSAAVSLLTTPVTLARVEGLHSWLCNCA